MNNVNNSIVFIVIIYGFVRRMTQASTVTFADLFRNSEEPQDYFETDVNGNTVLYPSGKMKFYNEKEGFPLMQFRARLGIIDSANSTSKVKNMTGNEEIVNYFYLLMHYKNVSIDGIELINPGRAQEFFFDDSKIGDSETDSAKKKQAKDDFNSKKNQMINDLKTRIASSKKLILFPMTTGGHWCLAYRRYNEKWKIMDSAPEGGVDFAKRVLVVLDITDASKIENLFNQKSIFECGIYTILYMLAVSTMSDEDIQTCRIAKETNANFLTDVDYKWMNLEIKKLYNLRYQADKKLKGPMMKIVLISDASITSPILDGIVRFLRESLLEVLFLVNENDPYIEKSIQIKMSDDNNVAKFEVIDSFGTNIGTYKNEGNGPTDLLNKLKKKLKIK